MYDPSIGRWLTPDPIEYDGGDVNLYGFVKNNPTNLTDPSGLKPTPRENLRGVTITSKNDFGAITPKWDALAAYDHYQLGAFGRYPKCTFEVRVYRKLKDDIFKPTARMIVDSTANPVRVLDNPRPLYHGLIELNTKKSPTIKITISGSDKKDEQSICHSLSLGVHTSDVGGFPLVINGPEAHQIFTDPELFELVDPSGPIKVGDILAFYVVCDGKDILYHSAPVIKAPAK
jgi:hypothetical protein